MSKRTSKILALILSLVLIFQQSGFAQVAAELNISSHLSILRSSFAADKFRPLHLRYLQYLPANNSFKLFLDKGDEYKGLSLQGTVPEAKLENTSKELLKYFYIGLTLPNDSFWVNLRPDAEDNIIDEYLSKTDIGKIMLETDLQLKKDTSAMTSPATPEGREYWNKLYKKAEELYGYDNVTIPTLTRPWIVPDEIIIRETTDSAYIYKATLKVMLEQDYLKDSSTYNFPDSRAKALNEYSSQLIRELIIPKLTKAVNSSKRYAPLRQVYYSLILASWFKSRYKGLSPKGTVPNLINSRDLTNLISKEAWSKTTYFQAYQKSFKEGEYNIQEPVRTPTGQVIRSYFSGGENFEKIAGPQMIIIPAGQSVSPAVKNLIETPTTFSSLGAKPAASSAVTEGRSASSALAVSNGLKDYYVLPDGTKCQVVPLTKDFVMRRGKEVLGLVNEVPGSHWDLAKLLEEYPAKWENSFVIVDSQDKLIGMVLAYIQPPNPELHIDVEHIFVRRLCVVASYRRKYVATFLLNNLSAQNIQNTQGNRKYIALQTDIENEAGNAIYRSLGFDNIATIKVGGHRDNIYAITVDQLYLATQAKIRPNKFSSLVKAKPAASSAASDAKGGIDFRALPIVTQAMSNLKPLFRDSPLRGQSLVNLNKEWQEIERMANSGITPSSERIKEYLQASCAKDNILGDKDKIILCIADILRSEEENCCATDPTLRDILVVLETANSSAELNRIFLG